MPVTGLSNPNSAVPNANPTTSTTYTVTGLGSNNCSATSTIILNVVNCPLGDNGLLSADNNILSYYNGINRAIEISLENNSSAGKNFEIKIINQLGQLILSSEKMYDGNNLIQVDMSGFSVGIYYLYINDGARIYSNKFAAY